MFSDPAALAELERIVHPLVRPRILAAIEAGRRSGAPVVVVEAIKLIEAGYGPICDEVWLITCPAAEQQQRLIGRGLAAADARQRARPRPGMSERLARTATRIIDTAGSADDGRTACVLQAFARRRRSRRARAGRAASRVARDDRARQ